MMRILTTAALAVLLAAPAARADRAAADRCAAGLSPASKALYNASLAEVLGGQSPRDALTGNARAMVMNGTLSRAEARPAAEAAGPCLMQAR